MVGILMKQPLLSVLMPVYNEKNTIRQIIEKVQQVSIDKEIIIVDDCSTDGTREILKQDYNQIKNIKLIFHESNSGKGKAIRSGLDFTRGEITIIQDGDLEYDPLDYPKLLQPILNNSLDVIYGSRFLNSENKHSYGRYYLGGRLVTWVTNILYGQKLTDEPTCYKVFRTELLKDLNLQCERFEFCPEATAKVAKRGIKIFEIPINYYPRKIEEGKKIRWTDGLEAIWTLLKFRFIN
jgi:glycosyltransferase involved in cell wall biosynthesis